MVKQNLNEIAFSIALMVTLSLMGQASMAVTVRPPHHDSCRFELAAKGLTQPHQVRFCQRFQPSQWTCARLVLKKYHSLDLAKETCGHATTRESYCIAHVLNRNYDPYVAKRVCQLK